MNSRPEASSERRFPGFARWICFGWYDGPTSGVVVSQDPVRAFSFTLCSWDEMQDVRIYSLAELPLGCFDRINAVLSRIDEPVWPMWVPRWEFATTDDRVEADRSIETLLNEAGSPEWVICTDDTMRKVMAFVYLDTDSNHTFATLKQTNAPFDQWLAFVKGDSHE